MKLALSDIKKAHTMIGKNRWKESKVYIELVIERIESMIKHINSKNN